MFYLQCCTIKNHQDPVWVVKVGGWRKILAQVELNLYTLGKYDDTLDFSSTLTGNSFAALCAMMIKKANSKALSYIYLDLT